MQSALRHHTHRLLFRNRNNNTSSILSCCTTTQFHAKPHRFTQPEQLRGYRGDSGEMKHRHQILQESKQQLSAKDAAALQKEETLLRVAQPKYDAIYANHVKLPTIDGISDEALFGGDDAALSSANSDGVALDIRRKRLIYRSKQRGWLEVDLLLGSFAQQFVPDMSIPELDEFERFVNLETIDIYNVLTLRTDVPDDFFENEYVGVVRRMQEWAKSSPLGKAEPETYAKVKMDHNLI